MPLLAHQIVLGRCLRSADADPWASPAAQQRIGLDQAELAELHDLVHSPGFRFTRRGQRSWCEGRTAEAATDVVMNAEILSYSRSKGLFAGISLEGSSLRSDGSANEKLYRQKLSAKDIIRGGKVKAPPSARELIALLNKKTPKNKSDPKSLQ